jgi:hypothetical protein
MKVINVLRLIEESLYTRSPTKNFTGSFKSIDHLISEARELNELHTGLFAYFAFHRKVDDVVTQYVLSGAVEVDSGGEIMVLMLSDESCEMPRTVTHTLLRRTYGIDYGDNAADQMVRWMFPAEPYPLIPGIILFNSVFEVSEAVYVPLSEMNSVPQVAALCRKTLYAARTCVRGGMLEATWVDALGTKLRGQRISYRRLGQTSGQLWFQNVMQMLKSQNLNLVSVVSMVTQLADVLLKLKK